MAKAIRVRSAAKKDTIEDTRVTVMCCEKERRSATKVIAVAGAFRVSLNYLRAREVDSPTGWTASPRVQDDPMITLVFLSTTLPMPTLYPCPRGDVSDAL